MARDLLSDRKEPWQLTFKEFARRRAAESIRIIRKRIREGSSQRVRKELADQFAPVIQQLVDSPEQSVKRQAHLVIVKNALERGDSVPEAVLRDHPGLGKKKIGSRPPEERDKTIAGRAEIRGIEFGDTVKALDDGRTWRVLQISGGPKGRIALGDPALTGKAREIRSMKELLQLTVVKKFDGRAFLRAFDKAFEDSEKSKGFKSSVTFRSLAADKARRRSKMGK